MGLEPTTLRDLVGCSTTELLGTLCSRAMRVQSIPTILTLAHHRVPSSSVVEHLTRPQRVVGSNPVWDSDFF